MRSGAPRFVKKFLTAVSVGSIMLAASAMADDMGAMAPAAVAPSAEPARATFQKFAQAWMDKVQRLAADEKRNLAAGPGGSVVTYRDYTDDFTTELRPTGHATAPYVGVLRYQEQIFTCRNMAAGDCSLSSRIPVTEIFRYEGGRWIY
jgi:hypothetical protein